MDGEAWWATVHGVVKSWTQLSDFTSLALKWSECYTKTSMNYSILKKWILKLLCSPGSTSLFYSIPFTCQALKYVFHIHFLVASSWTIFNMVINFFIHWKSLRQVKSFSRQNWRSLASPNYFDLCTLWYFCTRYYLLSIFFVTFASRK